MGPLESAYLHLGRYGGREEIDPHASEEEPPKGLKRIETEIDPAGGSQP